MLSLRVQISLAMVACVVITVGMAFGGAMLMMAADERHLFPNTALGGRDGLDRLVLVAVGLVSTMAGGVIALFLAGRLARQIEQVSLAAKDVASGDLSARAGPLKGYASETFQLWESFNVMAEALERFQDQAIESSAAIAHELRTPLAILLGRLQGMQEGIFPNDRAEIAGLIRQVESLGQIVNDLAVVSLASAGRLEVFPSAIDVAREIEKLISDMQPQIEKIGLRVEMHLAATHAWADGGRIRQAVLALVENVLRHAAAGGEIGIVVRSDGPCALIEVLDRGPGVSASDRGRMFDPFWRRERSRSRDSGGTGLGLSVAASIVRAHGGTIEAAERNGGGTIVRIRLPSGDVE